MRKTIVYKTGNLLSYAEYGDPNGYPILIQHGLIASIVDADLFKRLMDAGTRLISIARAGYGESSPYIMKNMGEWGDIVSIFVHELGLDQLDVLGMSSGAPYSYAIGYRLPEKVRNIYIFSGTPALYDEEILAHWPYGVTKNASIAEMEKLAYELFFSNLSKDDLARDDIKDSMMNQCFGIAQDLKIRCMDWGFRLGEVKANVFMRHSQADQNVPFITAEMTSRLLTNCIFEARETDAHFSDELLDDFIREVMIEHF